MKKILKKIFKVIYVALSIGAFLSLYFNARFPTCEAAATPGEIDTPRIVYIGRELQRLPPSPGLNINKLAYCVAKAETQNCTTGMGITKNNCHGLMTWERGFREGKWYNTIEESYEDFKRLWMRSYKTFPTYQMADKYTGGDQTQIWLNTVTNCYYEKSRY